MCKRKIFLIIAIFLFTTSIDLQTIYGQITWQKTYGWDKDDKGRVIKQINDGGFIIVGDSDWYWNSDDRKLYGDIVLIRLDALGDTLWVKKYGGTYWDQGYDVLETENNDFLVLGSTDSYGPNFDEVYLLKTDNNGDTLWTKKYGRYEADFGFTLLKTNKNGFIIAGITYSLENGWDGSSDAYVIRVDSFGNKLWEKIYGGVGDERIGSILQTSDYGFLFAGSTSSFGKGSFDFYLIKTNQYGDTLWTRTYGDSFSDGASGIIVTEHGEFIVGGNTEYLGPYGLEHNIFIIKTDTLGKLIWEKEYNLSYGDFVRSIQPTRDGGFIIAGSTVSPEKYVQALLMKLDENGDSLWTRTFGFDDYDDAYSVVQTNDGGYTFTGFSEIGWDNEIFVVKTDPDGFVTALNNKLMNSNKSEFLAIENYPNPFNQQTIISYQLPLFKQNIEINIYDTKGARVKSLFKGSQPQGKHVILWNGLNDSGKNLSSGIYFIQISINQNQFNSSSKIVLIR